MNISRKLVDLELYGGRFWFVFLLLSTIIDQYLFFILFSYESREFETPLCCAHHYCSMFGGICHRTHDIWSSGILLILMSSTRVTYSSDSCCGEQYSGSNRCCDEYWYNTLYTRLFSSVWSGWRDVFQFLYCSGYWYSCCEWVRVQKNRSRSHGFREYWDYGRCSKKERW